MIILLAEPQVSQELNEINTWLFVQIKWESFKIYFAFGFEMQNQEGICPLKDS